MIKNIIFDLGGVVIGRGYAAAGDGLRAFRFLQGEDFPGYWKKFDGGVFTQSQVAEAIAADTGMAVEEAFGQVTEIMYMFDEFSDTVELVKQLSGEGYRIYVLSNMPHEFYEHIRSFEVFGYFDGVLISSTEKMLKPDPRFFQLLLDRYELNPEESLFVDDKPRNVAAATELGFHVCQFSYPEGVTTVRSILSGE